MLRFSTPIVSLLAAVAGFAVAFASYRPVWHVPIFGSVSGSRLFCVGWIITALIGILLLALARLATWRDAARAGVVALGVTLPLFPIATSFEDVRLAPKEKSVVSNLRALAAAADQYFLEEHVRIVLRQEDLVGPGRQLRALNSVFGEDYRGNFPFHQGGVWSTDLPTGRIVSYNSGSEIPGEKWLYKPGEIPPWRTKPPVPASPRSGNPLPAKASPR